MSAITFAKSARLLYCVFLIKHYWTDDVGLLFIKFSRDKRRVPF
jgi:hypothetical protein